MDSRLFLGKGWMNLWTNEIILNKLFHGYEFNRNELLRCYLEFNVNFCVQLILICNLCVFIWEFLIFFSDASS